MSNKDTYGPFFEFVAAYSRVMGKASLVVSAVLLVWTGLEYFLRNEPAAVGTLLIAGIAFLAFGAVLYSVRSRPPDSK